MNLTHKKAMIRAVIVALLILVLLIGFTVKAGNDDKKDTSTETTAHAEEPTQEPLATTEPATIPTEEQESIHETEPPTDATEPTETEPPTETTPRENEPTRATEPATEPTAIETEPPAPTTQDPTGEWVSLGTYKLTAYCACQKCCGKDPSSPGYGITATGAKAVAGITIAVDPRVIPYGSSVKINDHIYIAQDTGGAINGNRIDVYFDEHQEALQFGVQTAEVFLQTGAS